MSRRRRNFKPSRAGSFVLLKPRFSARPAFSRDQFLGVSII
jgi:hypothetical protein